MLATNIWHALTPETTARTWMDLMKVMKLDEELLAELHRGSLGDVVSELEAKAEAKGLAMGEAKVIVRVLDKRGIELTEAQRERILGCVDLELLGRWLDASLDVTSADEIFG
jgi:hypothetical protein